jgi:hypothetical protein
VRITRHSQADRQCWIFGIVRKKVTNAPCYQGGGGQACFRQDHSKFVSAMPRGGVYRPAAVSQNLPQSAKRPISHQMPMSIVDLFQPIKVQQYKREVPFGTFGSSNLRVQYLEEVAMVAQTGQRIARCLMTEFLLYRPLLSDIDGDDFVASKVSLLVIETATA